jgi:hypothetical protein
MGKRKKKQAARRRGLTADQRLRQRARAREELLYDPGTDPGLAAEILRELSEGGPVDPDVAPRIGSRGGMERLRAVSEAVLAGGRDPAALSFAADVAIMDGRVDEAERHLRQAVLLADHPELHLRLVGALNRQDRVGEAIDVLDALLRADPAVEPAMLVRRDLLARAEPQVVARFLDRTPLVELQATIGRHAGSHGLQDWLEAGAVTEEEVSHLAAERLRLIDEWAWLMPVLEDERAPLEALAEDEAAPEELRRSAEDWLTWALWGLWEVEEPREGPGAVLTELVTGVRVHAEVPADVLDGLPRWSVLLGYVVPVDGVWRAGSDFEVLTPLEARLLVHELLDDVMTNGGDAGKQVRPMLNWARRVHDDLGPLWLPHAAERPSPEAMVGLQLAMRAFAPYLIAGVRAMRGTSPGAESSGEFALTFDDPDAAWQALAAHDEFESDEADGLVWPGDDEDGARAYLERTDEGEIVADTDEDELEGLLDLLRRVGHPAMAEELPVEPPEPPVALPDLSPAELPAWLEAWPDEPLDLFDGVTPRDAVDSYEATAAVEVLVRYLEHDADRRGLRELDMEALREQFALETK